MSEGSGRICWLISKLSPGLHVIVFNGLCDCCEKEVAPDAGCKENGSEEVSGEREERWDDRTLCNIYQFMELNPLSWILICLYAG